jgi:hypothetical protein
MRSPISASRPPPEIARLYNGDTLKPAECEEVLVHSNQDGRARRNRGTENWNIARVTANSGRQVCGHDRGCHPHQEAAQLTNFAFGEVELIAKFATEFLGNEVGNHQLMMRQHVLEEFGTHAGPADRGGDQDRGIENDLHDLSRTRNTSSSVWTPWA